MIKENTAPAVLGGAPSINIDGRRSTATKGCTLTLEGGEQRGEGKQGQSETKLTRTKGSA